MNTQYLRNTEPSTHFTYATFILIVLSTSPTIAADLTVDNTAPACDDVSGAPFCTIQSALNNAVPGDTITVAPGFYPENIAVNTSNLVMVGVNHPEIGGPVSITATGVRFEGFKVSNRIGNRIDILGNRNTILRNQADGRFFTGINVGIFFPQLVRVTQNLVAFNRISGGGGIDVFGSQNRLVGNVITDAQLGQCISLAGNNNVARRNQVRDSFCLAAFSIAGSRNTVTNNRATNNIDGFVIGPPFLSGGISSKNRLRKNVAIGNTIFGFTDVFGGRNIYEKNRCKRNGFGGSQPPGLCAPQRGIGSSR